MLRVRHETHDVACGIGDTGNVVHGTIGIVPVPEDHLMVLLDLGKGLGIDDVVALTVLGRDVRLDNQIQIGHNVMVGDHTAMAGCSAAAGSAKIGRYCLIGGGAGVLGHLEVCDQAVITAMSLVTHSIREPGEYSSGTPLMDNRSWRKSAVRFKQLDSLFRGLHRDKEE